MSQFLSAIALSAQLASWSDVTVPSEHEQLALLQIHYTTVACELEAADVSALGAAQRAERALVIERLRAFSECADFGRNVDFPFARVPHFRDASGRRCAVAELMHLAGEDAFVERVRFADNYAWLCDLAGDPALDTWLARSGVSYEEATRIHVPPITGTAQGGGRPGSYGGPGDTVPGPRTGGGGSSVPGSGGTTAGAPSTGGRSSGGPGPSSTPSQGPSASPRPTTSGLATTDDDGWWLWWEHNKTSFLLPNRLDLTTMPSTGGDGEDAFLDALERARRDAAALFANGVASSDWSIRATSAVALARTGRTESVAALAKLVDDPNSEVRHLAILGLGASGDIEAASLLLRIARDGALQPSTARISAFAKPYAIVGLALARRRGLAEAIDIEIEALVKNRQKSERESIATAALVYHMLAPSERLEKLAVGLANDASESPSVRCRAVESLRSSKDSAAFTLLQRHLHGDRLDLRRSAALALGEMDHPLARPALMTAFEMEVEPLTKGFVLTSIGRKGGDEACAFLARQIERGEGGMRRWAALGLGLLAHSTQDPNTSSAAIAAIRLGREKERNRAAAGAYCIAAGLARDEGSRAALIEVLAKAGDPRQRMYAATGLALLGGDASLEALRARAKVEPQGIARIAIAQGIARFGLPVDAPILAELLEGLSDAYEQAICATAIAAHGTPETLRALRNIARVESGSTMRRAASIEGLGVMLSRTPTLALCEVARGANYTVFTDWVSGLFQSTL